MISYSPRRQLQFHVENIAWKNVSPSVGETAAVEVGLFHEAFQRAVWLEEGDAELPRTIHWMDEYAGPTEGKRGQVSRPVQVVAVERQERRRPNLFAAASQGVAGTAGCA